ncbi:TPA: sulfatase-like hydrolase/transferase [Escherichia coli]|nr:sulfatase-like hydrolase/transferase [Escherichia coli]
MKSALKKSVVSTSISLILASGMAAFAAHAADDVKLKATKTNVAFSDFTPTEYSTKGKPNIIVLTMDDLGYGQLPFDKGSFDPKTMENREVVDTYKIGIDKAIEAAQKSTPTLLSLMDEGVRFTNGYVAHGVSGPSRAAIMTGRAPARFGVYSNTDAQDGIPLTETFLPELFQNHGYYTAAVGKWHLSKISNVPVPEDKQTRDYHDNFTTFSAEEWQPQNRGFDYFMGFHAAGTAYYNSPSLFKNRERVPAKGYISDQLTDEAIGVVDRAKTLDQPFMLYLAYNAPHLPNDNPAPEQYQKQFNTGSQTADNYYASVYSVDQGVKRILEQLKKNGQYDNTIILFTSDNGAVIDGPLPLNGAQKGYKSQTYPGGTHTPMFMWWKGKIFIRQFESFVSRFLGNGHTSCIFQESCKDNLVVESNGDIYECDHFVYPQYKIGNINKSELKTMNSVQLTAQKKRISAKCQQCVYKPICNGGCPKHRITKVNNETVSYFCEGYKILFSTMVPYMNAMVELAKNRVPLYHIMDVAKQMENN